MQKVYYFVQVDRIYYLMGHVQVDTHEFGLELGQIRSLLKKLFDRFVFFATPVLTWRESSSLDLKLRAKKKKKEN